MEKMLQIRKNQKGFTLVEVIVVLVILAILAAVLIPTLTGYIDKAKDKVIIAETRNCVMAAQTLASEAYASKGTAPTNAQIEDLAEVAGTVTATIDTNYKLTGMTYNDGSKTCTYNPSATGDKYTVAKNK